MEDAGAEGGEDEMTEPKADQEMMADQSSERDDQGQVQSSDQGLKIQRKGSIMSPMKDNNRDENLDENEVSGEKGETQRAQRTRNNSNKFTTPLQKKRSQNNEKTRLRSGAPFAPLPSQVTAVGTQKQKNVRVNGLSLLS